MATETSAPAEAGAQGEVWDLRIYVFDNSPRARLALANLRHLLEAHLPGRFRLEVIDLEKDPGAALRDDVLALPMIVRKHPPPERTMVGTLADAASTRRFLELDGRDAGQEEEHAAAAEGGDSP